MPLARHQAGRTPDLGALQDASTAPAPLLRGSTRPLTGYLHPGYAESLAEFGAPRRLPFSGGWVLERPIPESSDSDAMGCYPLFVCADWDKLPLDLDLLSRDLVSLTLVADPFGNFHIEDLRRSFDLVLPFKQHLVTDLSQPVSSCVSSHHRYYARWALRNLRVEQCRQPLSFLDDWVALYANLQAKHNITGIRAFSRTAFAKQLSVPGLVMFRACAHDAVAGIVLFYVQGDVAYGHLSAASAAGYKLRVTYALLWRALESLRDEVRWVDHGSAAGLNSDNTDPLWQFKAGWSTCTRTAFLCGKIFQPHRYSRLVSSRRIGPATYFPAYRAGEYGAYRPGDYKEPVL
jgi:hypothetical protein